MKIRDLINLLRDAGPKLAYDATLTAQVLVPKRIHEEGLNQHDHIIGKYSKRYLSTRQVNNRGNSPNVIISLTRGVEQAYDVEQTSKGGKFVVLPKAGKAPKTKGKKKKKATTKAIPNAEQKVQYMEARYGELWELSPEDTRQIEEVLDKEMQRLLDALQ